MDTCLYCKKKIEEGGYETKDGLFCCPLHLEEFYYELGRAKGTKINLSWPTGSIFAQHATSEWADIMKPKH